MPAQKDRGGRKNSGGTALYGSWGVTVAQVLAGLGRAPPFLCFSHQDKPPLTWAPVIHRPHRRTARLGVQAATGLHVAVRPPVEQRQWPPPSSRS